jgi:3-oxoacid CoA-transferase subunit B
VDKVGTSAAEAIADIPDGRHSPSAASQCGLPPTGECYVHRIITDLGVLDVTSDGLALVETAPGVTAEAIKTHTHAPVRVDTLTAAF